MGVCGDAGARGALRLSKLSSEGWARLTEEHTMGNSKWANPGSKGILAWVHLGSRGQDGMTTQGCEAFGQVADSPPTFPFPHL